MHISACLFLSRSMRIEGTRSLRAIRDASIAGLAILAFAPLAAQAAESASFRGNAQHTGVYNAAGVPKLGGVKWTFKTEGQVIASPAVHGDTVYVGSTGGTLYAIDRATGTSKWQYPVKSRIASSPAVAGGLVYFGAFDGNFYAVSETTGALKWDFQTAGE